MPSGFIFRSHGAAWRSANRGHVSLGQFKVMSAIENSRTAAPGGHIERCENRACGHTAIAYNSCIMGKIRNGELASHSVRAGMSFRQPVSPLRSAPEQGDQFVWRPEDTPPQIRGNDGLDRVELLCGIGAYIDLGGCEIGMSKPQGHLPDVLRRLQNDHRACVSQHMGRDAFFQQAGVLLGSGCYMLLKQISKSPAG